MLFRCSPDPNEVRTPIIPHKTTPGANTQQSFERMRAMKQSSQKPPESTEIEPKKVKSVSVKPETPPSSETTAIEPRKVKSITIK